MITHIYILSVVHHDGAELRVALTIISVFWYPSIAF
jgi:hypothetical protein